MEQKELREKLKSGILEALNIEDIQPKDLSDDTPLFGDAGLGLDSIDALELTLLLERDYDCKIKTPEEGKKILYSVETMASWIESQQK